jgi:hypothetical protein
VTTLSGDPVPSVGQDNGVTFTYRAGVDGYLVR